MGAVYKIDILNPKALQLLKGMEDLQLIKVTEEDFVAELDAYLEKMKNRQPADDTPTMDEIVKIVKEVRAERYAGQQAAKNRS